MPFFFLNIILYVYKNIYNIFFLSVITRYFRLRLVTVVDGHEWMWDGEQAGCFSIVYDGDLNSRT